MKKVILAVAVVSASGAQASDYRTDLSEGYSPNADTVEADRKLRKEEEAMEYQGEYLELICTIDGVPNKQISVPTSAWKRETKREDINYESTLEYKVEEDTYRQSLNTSTASRGGQMSYYYTSVDRMTGEYRQTRWSGSLSALLNHQLYGRELLPAETERTGICVPGVHKTEQLF